MSPSRSPLLFFLLLIVALSNNLARTQTTDSFFARDSIASSSVRRPTDVRRTLVAFPLNLKPHVVIRNRGQPLPEEVEQPAPTNRLQEERRQRTQTQIVKSSEEKARGQLVLDFDRDSLSNFHVPFILNDQQQIVFDQLPPGVSIERIPHPHPRPARRRKPKPKPTSKPTSKPRSKPRSKPKPKPRPIPVLEYNIFSQQQLQQQQQQQLQLQQQRQLLLLQHQQEQQQQQQQAEQQQRQRERQKQRQLQRQRQHQQQELQQQQQQQQQPISRLREKQQTYIAQPHPPFGEIVPFDVPVPLPTSKPKPKPSQQPRSKSNRQRSSTSQGSRTELNNFRTVPVTPKATFRNSTVIPRPVIRTTAAPPPPSPPPTLTRHLDEFFGGIRIESPVESATQRVRTSTKAPVRVKQLPKAISPTITIHGDSGTKRTRLKQTNLFDVSGEDFDIPHEVPRTAVRTGINPQFVEFSSLTTESATTMRPTITAWKGTPKFRTILHPPPLSLQTALGRQKVTSRITSTARPVKVPRRRIVVSTTEAPTFLVDDSHSFEDVPRVATRTRTVIRKIPTQTPTRTRRPVAISKIPVTKSPRVFFRSEDGDEDDEEPEDGFPTTKRKSNRYQLNAITPTSSTLNDRNNNPLLPRTHLKTRGWQAVGEPLFHGPTVEKFRNRNRGSNKAVSSIRRPFAITQKSLADYLDIEPASEVDNVPTESDEEEPALRAPKVNSRVTTPLQTRFIDESVEDFGDDNSYEDEFVYDDYIEPTTTPSTTTTTTRTAGFFRQKTRRPGIKPRPVTQPLQQKSFWNTVTNPSTVKPTKPSVTSIRDFQISKPTRPKDTGSSSTSKTGKCDRDACRLPYCYCGGSANPGGFAPSETPQIILLTFDDAVNDLNWPLYQTLFFSGKTNPNGCPILTTLYVSHEWTDYGKVEAMYAAGHEIASHSISHGDGASYSKQKWHDEIYGQKEILSRYGGVKAHDIQGMRAPFLAIGGDKMFGMLHEDNFTYDSSVTILENKPPVWPYTLDYGFPHECTIPPCPTKSFPGLWEIPMVSLTDLNGGSCSMADSCSYSTTAEGVYEMLTSNFLRHYESNRAPLGLFYHSSWFLTPHRKEGFLKFLDQVLQQDDVYFITSMQMIEWMRRPTSLSNIKNFAPWQCHGKQRQPACRISRECSISFRGDMRSFRTCGECPSIYPWVGKTNV